MAGNPIPEGLADLLLMAGKAADGLALLESALGIAQNTEAKVRAEILRLRSTQLDYKSEEWQQSKRYEAQREIDGRGRAWLLQCRRRLSCFFGDSWSPKWAAAGFEDGSTAVSKKIAIRQQQLTALAAFLAENRAYEDVALEITAVKADQLAKELTASRTAIHSGAASIAAAKRLRDAAYLALTKRMRGLLGELAQLTEKDDERWRLFGLNAPADPSTPEIAVSPSAQVLGDGVVTVDVVLPARARYAHLWVQQEGVDEEPRRLKGRYRGTTTLRDLPQNVPLLLFVAGVNQAGAGALSPPVQVTIGEQRATSNEQRATGNGEEKRVRSGFSRFSSLIPRFSSLVSHPSSLAFVAGLGELGADAAAPHFLAAKGVDHVFGFGHRHFHERGAVKNVDGADGAA